MLVLMLTPLFLLLNAPPLRFGYLHSHPHLPLPRRLLLHPPPPPPLLLLLCIHLRLNYLSEGGEVLIRHDFISPIAKQLRPLNPPCSLLAFFFLFGESWAPSFSSSSSSITLLATFFSFFSFFSPGFGATPFFRAKSEVDVQNKWGY